MRTTHEDRVLVSARREALVALLIALAAMTYTVVYCARHGYGRTWDSITFVWGFPDWVFWGIVSPWLVCVAVAWWFAYRFMTDEPLGDDADSQSAAEDRNHAGRINNPSGTVPDGLEIRPPEMGDRQTHPAPSDSNAEDAGGEAGHAQ
jgi:hypothetical protein